MLFLCSVCLGMLACLGTVPLKINGPKIVWPLHSVVVGFDLMGLTKGV
jgi:hypothetical protein